MVTEGSDSRGLHLPDLVVKGFRGIEDLTVSRLGRVNLISGRNGVGKTSLLDAVRLYAARGRYSVLSSILRTREELINTIDEDGDEIFTPDWEALFYGRDILPSTYISVGPGSEDLQLSIRVDERALLHQTSFFPEQFVEEDLRALRIEYQHIVQNIPMNPSYNLRRRSLPRRDESKFLSGILCEVLGPGLPSNADVARFWYNVALTDDEKRAVNALNLIFNDRIDRVTIIGDDRSPGFRRGGHRAVARIAGEDRPVQLKSLGDGAVRLFSVALALANSRDGFLLIDEVENGIHYSLQFDFWKMVMKTAYENNVQVFATTHSWDCVRGFAWAALETEEVEGHLVRMYRHRKSGKIRAVEYSERDLKIAAEQGIEVR